MAPVLHMALSLLIGLYIGISFLNFDHEPLSTSSLHAANDLRKAQSDILQWRQRSEKLAREYAQAVDKIKKLEAQVGDCNKLRPNHPAGRAADVVQSSNLPNPNSHPVCQKLPYPTPSATSLWHQHINSILEATKLPNDKRFKFHDFTAQVLQIISPRLPRSVKSLPYDWASVEEALTIGWERYQYLQLSKSQQAAVHTPPRPVKILLMGGSLLVGTNCRKLLSELNLGGPIRLPKRDCTWSNRLGQFLNAWAGGELVEVTKVAMGGTNTATGSVILQYDLIPEQARNPDIVFNAYSTNDMHILTVLEAQSANTTLRDKVFEMTQTFVRQVLQSCNTKNPPLLLHIDDYLGNEQRAIWDTTELSQGVQVLANYYGFSTMSYADTVRDIVYGDSSESWLSPDWWGTGKFEREIHPGMGMHISATWVALYNMLNLVTTYCSLPAPHLVDSTEYRPDVMGLPKLHNVVAQAKGKPQQRPSGLPPPLTQELLIESVTALWKNSKDEAACDSQERHQVKCPFSWISGLSLQQNNQTWIKEYFQQRASLWKGWEISSDGGKMGLVPTNGTGSQLVLDFTLSQPIRAVTFFIMKSYGEKWEGSRLEVRVKSQEQKDVWKDIQVREMVGFHAKNTSEVYTEAFELSKPIPVGSSLRLGAKLVGGTTFKLLGLAVCS
jgi:lysophospholipase L1-like esterase